MNSTAEKMLAIAATQVGVREHRRNRGPEIDDYNLDVGHDPTKADPWCAIFVCAMLQRACLALGLRVPIHLTAGVFTLDERAPPACHRVDPVPGAIFIKVGHAHTGLVVALLDGDLVQTIEGNTNGGGSSDGDGVYLRTRHRAEVMGYLDVSLLPEESL